VSTTVRSIKKRRREAERRALELEAKILEWAEGLYRFPSFGEEVDDIVVEMRAAVASPWPREEKGK
jgi:predicted Ser/Thr protein kinase